MVLCYQAQEQGSAVLSFSWFIPGLFLMWCSVLILFRPVLFLFQFVRCLGANLTSKLHDRALLSVWKQSGGWRELCRPEHWALQPCNALSILHMLILCETFPYIFPTHIWGHFCAPRALQTCSMTTLQAFSAKSLSCLCHKLLPSVNRLLGG